MLYSVNKIMFDITWKVQLQFLRWRFKDPHQYNVEWGKRREAYYSKYGPFPCTEEEIMRLESLRNKYIGQRIFIVGNGPSLSEMPLEKIINEWSFAVNRIYLLFKKTRWRPSFYTITDWRVAPDVADEINKLSGMTFFFPERFKGLLRNGNDVLWYWKQQGKTAELASPLDDKFAFNIHSGIRSGGSVLVTAIQIAYHMGFDPIYLIGVDHKYRVLDSVLQSGPNNNGTRLYLESTQDDDINHFDPTYFGRNRHWRAPDIDEMTKGFQNCYDAISSRGRKIFNATLGGYLDIFERVNYDDLF